jgi:hypothetical protein
VIPTAIDGYFGFQSEISQVAAYAFKYKKARLTRANSLRFFDPRRRAPVLSNDIQK